MSHRWLRLLHALLRACFVVALVVGITVTPVLAACTMHTIYTQDGRVVMCQTCCLPGGFCQTLCQ